MSAWFASKRRISIALEKWRAIQRGKPYTSPDFRFDDSMPLVLTHGDISLNNVRIGTDGTVWLLDWGRAGVYPRWFEYAAMMTYKDFLGQTPRSWLRLAPFVAGWYKSQNHFMTRIRPAFTYFALQDPDPDATD
ncbi:hypothetical protein EW026_g3994 [Hermanssonia centrifuga]|uniref:Aminoglycoside phosphotransferase domain-containing protein n=1 Tax=Hermanssonia centrifuga TaxID=98765 RepID=A0A4S4KIH8_9APHY|nr:hypothetical protein EW026_g3994 [Hermanssonia centrifuga]